MAPEARGKSEGLTLSSHVDKEALFDKSTVAYDLFMRLIFSEAGVSEQGTTATVVDLRTLADGLTDDQLKRAVATQLKVSVNELDVSSPDPKIAEAAEKNYQRINTALSLSSKFIREKLGLPLTAEVANARVNSWSELLGLLKKVSVFSSGEGGLDRHLAYCALIKGAIAAIELGTRYADQLEKETDLLQSITTVPRPENKNMPLVFVKPFSSENGEVRGVLSGVGAEPFDVVFEIRDKSWESIMRKFLSKAQSNAKEAYKDEVAMRFKFDGRRHGVAKRIVEFYKLQFNWDAQKIANKGVMNQSEFDALFSDLKNTKGARGLQIDPESNPKSDPSFAVLQINGKMMVPPNGDLNVPRRAWRERSFELQFVDTKRKPHTGLASDAVYALRKDVVIATRLLGGFEKRWFLQHASAASMDVEFTHMTQEQIFNDLLDQGFIFKKPGSRDKYAATSVWKDWLSMRGLVVDNKLRKAVEFEVAQAQGKKK